MEDVTGPSRRKPVVDASVVISLSKIGRFHLLRQRWGVLVFVFGLR